ncbi:unnamed protein product [Didymodactylos carnosus]|uniref:Tyrosine specific protein phosphatases domain-containing protein n=1 Tax=Didymodactylos carnosus TaxID=1234261 RepID=A0A8S2ECS2_9BILA|nr:unnamed protein product [Didymodactylos carnosus]CAF3881884.1 unnamed protein product [Didymodactylos carnosus]
MGDFAYKQIRYRQTHRDDKKKKSPYGGGIPDRWLDYNGVHQPIPGTRFVAFKCPLKPELQKNLPADMRFTLGDLVEKLDDQGQELGLIIDLTNTERYYKPIDIADARIKYHKMMTPGHHNIPSEECYQQFAGVVKSFLEQNQDNEKLIGVHCTHGLNRTGYLITRYIIEYLNKSPQDAIDAFNTARGHQMEKYCEDLKLRTAIT